MTAVERIREVVCRVGALPDLGLDEDMADAGFSSMKSLELLVELESEYDISIPDQEFISSRTCRSLAALVSRLCDEVPA